MTNSSDVAKLAGVSQSTVSYVLSGKRSISEDTRRRVIEAMKQLNYVPTRGRSAGIPYLGVIALMVEMTEYTQIAEVLPFIRNITVLARHEGYEVLQVSEDTSAEELRRLASSGVVDAVVMMDIERHDPRVELAQHLDIPVVPIGTPEQPGRLRCVDLDNDATTRLAVEELAAVGARQIVVVDDPRGDDRDFVSILDAQAAGESSAKDFDVPLTMFHPRSMRWDGILPLAKRMDSWAGRRVGVFCRSPQMTQWVLQAMTIQGLDAGTDIALVGVCPDDFAMQQHIPVTNVSPEIEAVCRRAMQVLFAQLEGQRSASGGVDLIVPKLTRRETTVPGFSD